MKSLTKDFFKTTLITSLAFIFAIGLSVVNAEWTTAPAGTPPVCPTGYPGCDAPLNVSSASQVKGGGLSLASLIVRGGIQIISGNPAIGKVLTSDGVGNATWQTPTTCTAAVSGTDTFTTSGTWTVPAGVTSIKVKVWGAGGNGGSGAPSYAGAGSLGGGGGGGGGAGGYAEKTINIPSGTTSYQVVVGTPGTAGFSAFDSTSVKATNGTSAVNHTGNESTGGAGGAGGAPVGSYSASQSGIAGSAGTNGTYISGCPGGFSQDGNGGNGGASYSPSTGGIGGVLANCSQAGPSGTTGTIGGGGGGGAGYGGAGGVGGGGRVVIEYSGSGTCSGGTTTTGGTAAPSITCRKGGNSISTDFTLAGGDYAYGFVAANCTDTSGAIGLPSTGYVGAQKVQRACNQPGNFTVLNPGENANTLVSGPSFIGPGILVNGNAQCVGSGNYDFQVTYTKAGGSASGLSSTVIVSQRATTGTLITASCGATQKLVSCTCSYDIDDTVYYYAGRCKAQANSCVGISGYPNDTRYAYNVQAICAQ